MKKIGVVASHAEKAQKIFAKIIQKSGFIDIKKEPEKSIDILLVLGGDGFLLRNVHQYIHIPIYGINCGTVGFLLNDYQENADIIEILHKAYTLELIVLKIIATDVDGNAYTSYAINEASIFRINHQAACIKIEINNTIYMDKIVGDGVIIATAAGSSAYNYSAGGSILPIDCNLLSVTGINVFRPRRWKSAILPDSVKITLEVVDIDHRPIMFMADHKKLDNIRKIEVSKDNELVVKLLFNSDKELRDKMIKEQFS